MTAKDNATLKGYFNTGDVPNETNFADFIDTAVPYKTYTATLSQSGTDAPVATVLVNTLGGTPVWARAVAGTYTCTLAGAFPSGKTFIVAFPGNGYVALNLAGNNKAVWEYSDVDSFSFGTWADGVASDDLLSGFFLEVRVYP